MWQRCNGGSNGRAGAHAAHIDYSPQDHNDRCVHLHMHAFTTLHDTLLHMTLLRAQRVLDAPQPLQTCSNGTARFDAGMSIAHSAGITVCLDAPQLGGGRCAAGLPVQKPSGLSMKPTTSTGITGNSCSHKLSCWLAITE